MQKRKAHILKPNKKTELPRHLIFFDVETNEKELINDEKELTLKLGVACYWRRDYKEKIYFNFKNEKDFWNWIEKIIYVKSKVYLIAHNVAFDFRVLNGFNELKKRGYEIKKFIAAPTMNIWKFQKNKHSICVLDNMNFFKSSLEKLGKSIGLLKLKMPINNDDKLLIYCRRDVDIMVEAWKLFFEFLKDNNLGNFSNTIAGQALTAYRHRFMKHKIFIHNNDPIIELERKAYHGGRNECFYIGKMPKRNYYLLDVNSMYPYVMQKYPYPHRLIKIIKNPKIKLYRNGVIAYCLLNVNEPVFSYIKDKKLIFPIGTFEAVLTTREYIYAYKRKYIKKIYKIAVYKNNYLFKEYVNFFYKKRLDYTKNKNEAFAYLCKLFLNSLYGKFGQRNEAFDEAVNLPHSVKKLIKAKGDGVFRIENRNGHITYRCLSGKVWQSVGLKEGFNSFCGIAAHITADARLELWRFIKKAGRKNVYYCDTDSVIVNQKGYNKLKKYIGNNLGYLSVDKKSQYLTIYGLKDYKFGKDKIIKGIKKNAVKLSNNKYKQIKFEGILGALRKGRLNKMIISPVIKTLKRDYNKGKILDGKVMPFYINS